MDGKGLLYRLRQKLEESSISGFMDDRTSYEYLWDAAIELNARLNLITGSQSITTVADQSGYTLNADFLKLAYRTGLDKPFIRYNDGSTTFNLESMDYNEMYYQNNSTSVEVPSSFAIIDDQTLDAQVSGTATTNGDAVGGLSQLTDTAGDFSDVSPGDIVHNTTDGSIGYVISKTSGTVIKTAMFGGTDNEWDTNDAYVIQPQGRYQLVLDPPPSENSHTVTVPYVQRPEPVFHDYGTYRFPAHFTDALITYAAWKYKYKDSEPNVGDRLYQHFNMTVGRAGHLSHQAKNTLQIKVNRKVR